MKQWLLAIFFCLVAFVVFAIMVGCAESKRLKQKQHLEKVERARYYLTR